MTMVSEPRWRKSTRSGANAGNCVEVADNVPGRVLVRDSKDREGGTLAFGSVAWQTFVSVSAEMRPVA
nr:DUF397 domain-containing protein [Micromonospora sp. DSM 115978]